MTVLNWGIRLCVLSLRDMLHVMMPQSDPDIAGHSNECATFATARHSTKIKETIEILIASHCTVPGALTAPFRS